MGLVNRIKSGTVQNVVNHLRGDRGRAFDRPEPLAAAADQGRTFAGERKVRLGDVTTGGRLRLDALTRYTQDVSDDDTVDAGLATEPGWVVRSTVVDELTPARLGERLSFTTFCSALGKRWAERRLTVTGDQGARYEVATLWICIDPSSGAPVPLTEQFHALYGAAASGRTVSARLRNPRRPSSLHGSGGGVADGASEVTPDSTRSIQWPLRVVDYDVYGHVNNAAYWSVVEEFASPVDGAGPRRVRLEYGEGVGLLGTVALEIAAVGEHRIVWWLVDGRTVACAAVDPLPDDFYCDASAEDAAGSSARNNV